MSKIQAYLISIRAAFSWNFSKRRLATMAINGNASGNITKMINQIGSNQESIAIDNSAFENFCRHAFVGVDAKKDKSAGHLFRMLDVDNDGKLGTAEEKYRFRTWLNELRNRKSAFIIVDVQNDFIDGSLSIRNGPARQDPSSIIAPINHLLQIIAFDLIVYTLDWHPPDHISFLENINSRPLSPSAVVNGGWKMGDLVPFSIDGREIKQRVWPKHCVQNTWGAELHPRLKIIDDTNRLLKIYKGKEPTIDSYSAFFDNDRKGVTQLHRELGQRGITDLYIGGLAYDVCVDWTARDALDLGYRVAIIDDCSAGLDAGAIDRVKSGVTDRNGVVINSDQIEELVQGKRVPWNWAYATAVRLFKQ